MTSNTKKPGRKPEISEDVSEIISEPAKLKRRRERVPIIEQKRVMSIPNKDESYMYRLVNDVEDNVNRFLKGGYEIVDKNGFDLSIDGRLQDSSWRHSAASQSVGGGITAYLMRIPKEWYIEDQQKKQRYLDDKTANLARKVIPGINDKNVYGEISINN